MNALGRAPVSDLSRWIGPLSPAFVALAADGAGTAGFGAAESPASAGTDGAQARVGTFAGDSAAGGGTADSQARVGTFAGNSAPGGGTDGDRARAAGAETEPLVLGAPAAGAVDVGQLRVLFHTLNNQLGVVLTYAELLEAKAQNDAQRARAAQVVEATLQALETTKQLRGAVVK